MLVALNAPNIVLVAISGLLLVLTLTLIIARPRGLDVAWFAGGAAIIALALGLITPRALTSIFHDTWDAAATLIALFILSEALDANGFFTWAALWLARLAGGSGMRLYALTLLLTTAVAALLANDGAVLMLTPIFARLLTRIHPERRLQLPYIFAMGFFADAMSGLFVPSNLTNIIIADANGLSFARVALWMALPTAAAFAAAGAAFALRFRGSLATAFDADTLGAPAGAIRDVWLFRAGWLALGCLVAGYIAGGQIGLPVSFIAGSVALVALALTQARGARRAGDILRGAPWSVLVYAIGMFVIITAAYDAQALSFLTQPLTQFVSRASGARGPMLAASLLATLAAAVNNLPAALIGVLALHVAAPVSRFAVYALILGVDIGPKLTPFGSLATLLWLGILERNGIRISWGHFIRENWWVTLLTLAAALAGLYASAALIP